MSPDRSQGRRSARPRARRLDVTVLLAIALPLLAVVAALLVSPGGGVRDGGAPDETPLTKATVVCPSGASEVVVASDVDASGRVVVRRGRKQDRVEVGPLRPAPVDARDKPVVLVGEGSLAPGLIAGRPSSPLVAPDCRAPAYDEWFTGVGAGAKHTSVLELVNPDSGVAVVDATVYGRRGQVEAELRGLAVPGRSVERIDLAKELPRRDELTLRVTTTRGRVSTAVLDQYAELGKGPSAADYLPSQATPDTTNLLLGIPPGSGRRDLVVTNPGDTETRATVKVVTEEAVFEAVGSEGVVVPPESVTRIPLSQVLKGENAEDAIGLVVESSSPVTATARFFVDGDLTHLAAVESVDETSLLVPEGTKRLLLGGASSVGSVRAVARDADGEVVADERVEIAAEQGAAIDLPDEAVLVTLTTNGTRVGGTVLATGDGAAVIRARAIPRSGLVADVRPGVP